MSPKTVFTLSLTTLAGFAMAQSSSQSTGDADVLLALSTLRNQPSVYLDLVGSLYMSNTIRVVHCSQFWEENTDSNGRFQVQSELLEYEASKLVGRVVADGNSVWKYSMPTQEYRTTLYGRYDSGPEPATYLNDAITSMSSFANSYGVFNVRLINQTYGGVNSTFESWIPGTTAVETEEAPYQQKPSDPYYFKVTYALGSQPRREVDFHLKLDAGVTSLESVHYHDVSSLGGLPRIVDWTITPYLVVPSSANFEPYSSDQIPGWHLVNAGK